MLQLTELKQHLLALRPEIDDLETALDLASLRNELAQLEGRSADPSFWSDTEGNAELLQSIASLKERISAFELLRERYDDALTLLDIALEEEDASLYNECRAAVDEVEQTLADQRLSTLLSGEYDHNNAIMAFHAGAGGTEAQDWAEMLYRMYTRFCEKRGWRVKVLDYLSGDEAGLKSASLLIEGTDAYGYLKSEAGVHRLVRISPFDSSGRRHTSFASIEVMPEIGEDTQVVINDEDLRVDTYRSGGAGGQHVNKTESAIRITHIPTGVVVACQNERSQHQNREVAMKMLRSKLVEIKEREHLEKIEDIKGVQKEIAWGSQIRSYVFMPYTMVKDHRTGFEMGNINAVMDGDIGGFINAYLKALSLGQL